MQNVGTSYYGTSCLKTFIVQTEGKCAILVTVHRSEYKLGTNFCKLEGYQIGGVQMGILCTGRTNFCKPWKLGGRNIRLLVVTKREASCISPDMIYEA